MATPVLLATGGCLIHNQTELTPSGGPVAGASHLGQLLAPVRRFPAGEAHKEAGWAGLLRPGPLPTCTVPSADAPRDWFLFPDVKVKPG